MEVLIAIFATSAIIFIALMVYLLRSRFSGDRAPKVPRKVRSKENAGATPPAATTTKPGRQRIISASDYAESERAASLAATPYATQIVMPMADPEPVLPPAIAAAQLQAIVFRQVFPPHGAPDATSYYGGVPTAQVPFEWPRDPASGQALHFVLQVDCAAIPQEARLGLFPATGTLHFFLDLQWGAGNAFRVIWSPAGSGNWRDIDPPGDIGLAYGDEAAHAWPWALEAEHGTPLLPRWPFDPIAVTLPPAEPEDDDDSPFNAPRWSDVLSDAQGVPVPLNAFTVKDITGDDGAMRRPFASFPQDWLAVQICAARLVRAAEREARHPRQSLFPELEGEAKVLHLNMIVTEARAWFDHALKNPAFGPVDEPERDAFWTWFAGHEPLTRLLAPRAIEAAVETTLHASPELARDLPADIIARIASRHALAVQTESGIHANSPDRMLAPFSDVQGDQQERAATHLLLLELSGNEAIGHHFGEGVYQFWITPDDLAARRFENVVLTTTAY